MASSLKSVLEPEPKAEPQPVSKPEAQPEPVPETEVQPEPEAKPESFPRPESLVIEGADPTVAEAKETMTPIQSSSEWTERQSELKKDEGSRMFTMRELLNGLKSESKVPAEGFPRSFTSGEGSVEEDDV